MKVTSIKISGFRGIKNEIELQCSPSFVVITGHNGSGKSTLCDAVEYALTGAIRKYGDRTEKKESVEDYIWWRGKGTVKDSYVNLGLDGDDGGLEVVRSANGALQPSIQLVEELLCKRDIAPMEALWRLCQTSIIRDEQISEFSLDLSETERFDLVKAAIGTYDLSGLDTKVTEVLKIFESSRNEWSRQYEAARTRLNQTTVTLSETRAAIERLPDINISVSALRKLLKNSEATISELIDEARRCIPIFKSKVNTIAATLQDAVDLEKEFDVFDVRAQQQQLEKLEEHLGEVKKNHSQAEGNLVQVEARVKQSREKQPEITAFGELYKLGEQLGRENEACRLCGSQISEHDYRTHLSALRVNIERFSEDLAGLLNIRASAVQEEKELENKKTAILEQIMRLKSRLDSITLRYNALKESVRKFGLQAADNLRDIITMLEGVLNEAREEQVQLDRHVTVLESTHLVEKATELEREINRAREEATGLENEMERYVIAEDKAKKARSMIRRITGEKIDEGLAAISPLLKELYMRLRPHTDWQELDYQIRGDVRRFLSLRVGDALNPSFMFSSGQRRAAGLAFLLAVSLSKAWSNLKTVILDDPMQHIDDYRALHLVEVLVAIRKAGYQIICTVEDPALADLLCRRLVGVSDDEGLRIEMEYTPGAGVKIAQTQRIGPLPRKVLRTA